jgi:hypothetical protein
MPGIAAILWPRTNPDTSTHMTICRTYPKHSMESALNRPLPDSWRRSTVPVIHW